MRTKIFAIAIVVLGLGLGAAAHATSSSPSSSGSSHGSNLQLFSSGWNFGISFHGDDFSDGGSSYEQYVSAAIGALRSRGFSFRFLGNDGYYTKKPPRDAGKVPEPGAVGVFSVGLLVAGALIRRLGRKA